ncbi:Acyl-CoA Delta(11) desaturase [Blattella germanica]|nr:Acyl-CoA Delta(11) desaturase [Blattella germanica]
MQEQFEGENEHRKEPLQRIKWFNVGVVLVIHTTALYSLIFVTRHLKWQTIIWTCVMCVASTFGVTAGAHRLWSHRAYKAKLPLRIILVMCYLSAGMYTVLKWARDHRVHHKYSDTDADPHNASRGFFYSHVGWLMQTKHPEVLRRGRQIDVSDVLADPVVAFQQKYFNSLQLLFWFILPVSIPCAFWGETLINSSLANITRWVIIINGIWSINSFAHIFGNRPYNRNINPSENELVAVWSMGEGWHNYHHTFPLDYKAAELGNYGLNITTALIDMFSYIGWAYDLKQPSRHLVEQAVRKTGDGTYPQPYQTKDVSESNGDCSDHKHS